MTLQRPVVAQLTLQAGLTYKVRLEILLSRAAQDASARTHSLELNMPLACLPRHLRSPQAFSLFRPFSGQDAVSPLLIGGWLPGTGGTLRCHPCSDRVQPAGRANCFVLALVLLGVNLWGGQVAALLPWLSWGSLPGTGKALRCCPGGGYGFLCFHAFVGRALLWPVRGVIALVNTLLCPWGIVPVGRVARRGFD